MKKRKMLNWAHELAIDFKNELYAFAVEGFDYQDANDNGWYDPDGQPMLKNPIELADAIELNRPDNLNDFLFFLVEKHNYTVMDIVEHALKYQNKGGCIDEKRFIERLRQR